MVVDRLKGLGKFAESVKVFEISRWLDTSLSQLSSCIAYVTQLSLVVELRNVRVRWLHRRPIIDDDVRRGKYAINRVRYKFLFLSCRNFNRHFLESASWKESGVLTRPVLNVDTTCALK